KTVPLPKHAHLAAYPNASLPAYHQGRLVYENEPDYFNSCAKDFRDQGVRLIGGCCGTTPEHVRALAKGIEGLAPLNEKVIEFSQTPVAVRDEEEADSTLPEVAEERHSVIGEFDPPKHLATTEFIKGAKALHRVEIDA